MHCECYCDAGVLVAGDFQRRENAPLAALWQREMEIVLHHHEDTAEVLRDLIGTNAM
jgi:hypothetical protein